MVGASLAVQLTAKDDTMSWWDQALLSFVCLISCPSLSLLALEGVASAKETSWMDESAQATAMITFLRIESGTTDGCDERTAEVIGGKAMWWTGLSRDMSSHRETWKP